jgi:serine palmitoyltransferase
LSFVLYILFRNPTKKSIADTAKLSTAEENMLIADWKPDPLFATPEPEDAAYLPTRLIVESTSSTYVKVNGETLLNFSANNFLNIAERKSIKKVVADTISVYGVGSCGPRGFYGSIDVHMHLEKKLAEFLNVPEAILYSDGVACISSVIPAFAKGGDLIIADESCSFGIQNGINLARSKTRYFKHNDMSHLEELLAGVVANDKKTGKALNRRFIVVEGIYMQHGDICPLDKVVALAEKYRFRLCLDDTLGFGMLGATGRGTPEHYNIPMSRIDMYVATLDCTIASVGGFCVAGIEQSVVDHQRLSGAGYCYSASGPPYTSTSSMEAIRIIETEGEKKLLPLLRENSAFARDALSNLNGLHIAYDGKISVASPLIHLRLNRPLEREEERKVLVLISEEILAHGAVVRVPVFVPQERAPPRYSLMVAITAEHTQEEITGIAETINKAVEACLTKGGKPRVNKKKKKKSTKKKSKK